MKTNKTNLNNLIQWSSSRYNECKKSTVIDEIIYLVERGDDIEVEYRSGCYSEASHQFRSNCKWTGGSYTLKIKDGVAKLLNYVSDTDISRYKLEEIILEKPSKNKFYRPAKRVLYTYTEYGVEIGEYDIINQNRLHYIIQHASGDKSIRWISKKYCTIIE